MSQANTLTRLIDAFLGPRLRWLLTPRGISARWPKEFGKIHNTEACELAVQAVAAVILVAALATHITEVRASVTHSVHVSSQEPVATTALWPVALQVGFVGLSIVILVTALNGITEEHEVQLLYRSVFVLCQRF